MASATEEALQLLQWHRLADVLEGALLDVACLAHRESELACRVAEIVGVAVLEPHPQLEDLSLGLGQACEHPLELPGQLLGRLVLATSAPPPLPGVLLTGPLARLLARLLAGPLAATALATGLAAPAATTALAAAGAAASLVVRTCCHAPSVATVGVRPVRRGTIHVEVVPAPTEPRPVPFVLTVLIVAVATSYLRGGRLSNVAEAPLSWSWLLFVGVGVQAAVNVAAARQWLPDAGWSGWSLLLLSQLLIVGFLIANRSLPGTWLVAAGLALNAIVIAANGAMPVDPAAIQAIGMEGAEVAPGKHTMMTASTRLPWLADVIPVRPLRSIVSVGDLVLAVGLLPMVHALMRAPRQPRPADGESESDHPHGVEG